MNKDEHRDFKNPSVYKRQGPRQSSYTLTPPSTDDEERRGTSQGRSTGCGSLRNHDEGRTVESLEQIFSLYSVV